MPDPIHLQPNRIGDVMADHFLAGPHQAINQMGAKKAGGQGGHGVGHRT